MPTPDRRSGCSDHIMGIALSDNTGWEELMIVDPTNVEESERAALKRLTAIYQGARSGCHRRPRFVSFPSSVSRGTGEESERRNSTGAAATDFYARDHRDSRLRKKRSTIQSSQSMDGTSSILFCSRNFTMSACGRLAGFERTDVARHFDLCGSEEISALTGRELQRAYLDNSERFRRRALCGVRETRPLSELLSPSYFIQAQIFPYNYQDVIVRGNATRINALFLREYFRQRHSIPELPMVRAFEGGYTDIFLPGSRTTSGIATSLRSIRRSC